MTDLHDAFEAWLLRGAREELPRDVALHASACPTCLRAAGALDALTMIDPGLADLPPVRVAVRGQRRRGLLRTAAGTVTVLLVIGAGIVVGGTLSGAPLPTDLAAVTPTPGGAVLGGQGGPEATETASASPTPSPTASPTASPSPGPAEPNPTTVAAPPPVEPGPVPTPPRTAAPTPTPQPTATPAPTTAATPVPTPCDPRLCLSPSPPAP